MAATDSYRLSVKETPLEAGPRARGDHPGAGALRSCRASRRRGETVELGVHENHVVFGADGVWLTTRRIDGQFPNYRQLVPETFEHELDAAARRAARRRPPRCGDGPAQLAAAAALRRGRADRLGADARTSARRASAAGAYTGEPIEIGFNAEFLRDGIESVAADEVALKLISPLRPGLITAEGDDFWYLIMPIRLAG